MNGARVSGLRFLTPDGPTYVTKGGLNGDFSR